MNSHDSKVHFTPINAVHCRVDAPAAIYAEISDHFRFEAPGARFSPAYKRGFWDGTVSLLKNNRLYTGLESHLEAFCQKRGYDFVSAIRHENSREADIDAFIEGLGLPAKIEVRDYQKDAFQQALRFPRQLFLSPTSSGKSLMIYFLTRFYRERTLIIVPTVSLVHQMAGDFVDYGYDPENIHSIAGGERWSDKPVVISTWQSVVKMLGDPEWFQQFGMVIGDEAHRFAAKSLIAIMESFPECDLRYGFTGSLDESKCNALTLQGLFGPVYQVTTTRELMDTGHVSNLDINVLKLVHPDRAKKQKLKYQEEVEYLISCPARNGFLRDLCLNLTGNTLLLYHRVEGHGQVLFEMIMKKAGDRPVYFIHGGIDGQEREEVRRLVEQQDNAIIIASVGTFSTGVNIKRLHNIIMAASFKSRVMNLQSIGRGLRLASDKDRCNMFDIVDDLSWKRRRNYTLQHGDARIRLYNQQQFDYSMQKIELEY